MGKRSCRRTRLERIKVWVKRFEKKHETKTNKAFRQWLEK